MRLWGTVLPQKAFQYLLLLIRGGSMQWSDSSSRPGDCRLKCNTAGTTTSFEKATLHSPLPTQLTQLLCGSASYPCKTA